VERVSITDRVADAIREVSAAVIEPRFRALADGDVEEKAPGDLVTVADREAEVALELRLTAIADAPIVGEEGCAADPTRLGCIGAERAWVVDPIDGTSNFVKGSEQWAVMVALLERGEAVASWIWQPVPKRMYVAARGCGATCNDAPLKIDGESQMLRGPAFTHFMPPKEKAAVERAHFDRLPGRYCAGFEYPAIIEGEQEFAIFWRTLPWDHVPGALLLTEAGGVARRPTGEPFLPYADGAGLVLARDRAMWDAARALLTA
jgi:fructose-1,6-bisphosphatase/inositol monophosphatase family enzyme